MGSDKIEVGDIIEWCDERYKVLEVYPTGDSGKVSFSDGSDICNNFLFNYGNEKAKIMKKKINIENGKRNNNRRL